MGMKALFAILNGWTDLCVISVTFTCLGLSFTFACCCLCKETFHVKQLNVLGVKRNCCQETELCRGLSEKGYGLASLHPAVQKEQRGEIEERKKK